MGHPGIGKAVNSTFKFLPDNFLLGKTTFLSYLLMRMLKAQERVVCQFEGNTIVLFDNTGATFISPVFVRKKDFSNVLALIDCNQFIERPAAIFAHDHAPFFCVVTASPRSSCWENIAHYGRLTTWIMKPFTLSELIQARQLQDSSCSERHIEYFFNTFGPSARDCYTSYNDVDSFEKMVVMKVNEMSWDIINKALEPGAKLINLDQGSHKVFLVRPHPGDRSVPITSIITPHVCQILTQADDKEQLLDWLRLYEKFLNHSETMSVVGFLFEPAFYGLCLEGVTTFKLHQLHSKTCITNKHYTSDPNSRAVELILPQLKLHVYRSVDLLSTLEKDVYYKPAYKTQPTFDSFIYEPMERRITAFQLTVSGSHEIKEKGIHQLQALSESLHLNIVKYRLIGVIPEGTDIKFTAVKSLDLEVYRLEMKDENFLGLEDSKEKRRNADY